MKRTIKILFIALFAITLFILFSISASAKSAYDIECANAEYADAIYFYSYDAKKVLYSKNQDKIIFPASTVKIMTGLISCEKLSARLDETVTISNNMLAGHSGTSMRLKVGEIYTIRDLLYGAICGGCNDAAQALAIVCSGSIDNFVEEMNNKATELEMTSTLYKNPTGLDANGSQTTAFDVAVLSKVAAQNKLYMQISSAKNYSYKGADGDTVIYNRNALISHFTATQYLNDFAKGLNAGSTDKGGYVVSTYFDANGSKYLCIVMGAVYENKEIYSYKIANELISTASSKFGRVKISSKNEKVTSLSVDCVLSTDKEVNVSCITEDDIYAFIPKDIDLKKQLKYRVYIHDTELSAPINEGDVLGGLNIYLDGELIGTTRIISKNTVKENEFLIFMKDMKAFLISRYFLIFLAVAIPSIIIFLYIDFIKGRRSRVRYIKF